MDNNTTYSGPIPFEQIPPRPDPGADMDRHQLWQRCYESWQTQRIEQLARQMAHECPDMWRRGDGEGGHILVAVAEAYAPANPQEGDK